VLRALELGLLKGVRLVRDWPCGKEPARIPDISDLRFA